MVRRRVTMLFLFMNFSSQPSLAKSSVFQVAPVPNTALVDPVLLGRGTLSILLGVFNDDVEFERNILPKAFMSIDDRMGVRKSSINITYVESV